MKKSFTVITLLILAITMTTILSGCNVKKARISLADGVSIETIPETTEATETLAVNGIIKNDLTIYFENGSFKLPATSKELAGEMVKVSDMYDDDGLTDCCMMYTRQFVKVTEDIFGEDVAIKFEKSSQADVKTVFGAPLKTFDTEDGICDIYQYKDYDMYLTFCYDDDAIGSVVYGNSNVYKIMLDIDIKEGSNGKESKDKDSDEEANIEDDKTDFKPGDGVSVIEDSDNISVNADDKTKIKIGPNVITIGMPLVDIKEYEIKNFGDIGTKETSSKSFYKKGKDTYSFVILNDDKTVSCITVNNDNDELNADYNVYGITNSSTLKDVKAMYGEPSRVITENNSCFYKICDNDVQISLSKKDNNTITGISISK